MTDFREGDLVTVLGDSGSRDGIVFQVPSRSKVVVAVPDAARGAVMRTFNPKALAERAEEGAHDEALRRLIRRTPSAGGNAQHGVDGPGSGSRGFTRAPAHRSPGK